MPRCSQRAGSPASSSTWVRKAITSWRVRSSCSRMRAALSLPAALARTASAVPRGTLPAASISSQAASSMRSQIS